MENRDGITLVDAKAMQCLTSLIKKLGEGASVAEAHQQTAEELEVEPYLTFNYLDYLSESTRKELEDLLIVYVNAAKNAPQNSGKAIDEQSEKVHTSVMATIEPLLITREQYELLNIIKQGQLLKTLFDRYEKSLGKSRTIFFLADRFNTSDTPIRSRMQLINLPEEIQQLLIQKRITIKTALNWLQDNTTSLNPKPLQSKTRKAPPKPDQKKPHNHPGTTSVIDRIHTIMDEDI